MCVLRSDLNFTERKPSSRIPRFRNPVCLALPLPVCRKHLLSKLLFESSECGTQTSVGPCFSIPYLIKLLAFPNCYLRRPTWTWFYFPPWSRVPDLSIRSFPGCLRWRLIQMASWLNSAFLSPVLRAEVWLLSLQGLQYPRESAYVWCVCTRH